MTMTENQPSVVDSNEFAVRRTINIAAPIEKVWAAVTQADLISRWFGDRTTLDTVEVGARGIFGWDGYGDFPVRIEELDPPHTIAYRWGNDNTEATTLDPEKSTVFRFTLEQTDGGTRLTVVETGFDKLADPAVSMESNRGGWDSELDELVAYLESGS